MDTPSDLKSFKFVAPKKKYKDADERKAAANKRSKARYQKNKEKRKFMF